MNLTHSSLRSSIRIERTYNTNVMHVTYSNVQHTGTALGNNCKHKVNQFLLVINNNDDFQNICSTVHSTQRSDL